MREPIIKAKDIHPLKIGMAKKLRQNLTYAEKIFWNCLRAKRSRGLKFRRQQVIAGFIVDFYCAKLRTVIEIDGGIHKQQTDYDRHRDKVLEDRGLRVLRFSNEEVVRNIELVIQRIVSSPLPGPPLRQASGEGTVTFSKNEIPAPDVFEGEG
jgi:very-short-patch-repair endonuclease